MRSAGAKTGKRDLARAFAVKGGPDRAALKALLADMADEGLLVGNRKSPQGAGQAAAGRGARHRRARRGRGADRGARRLGRGRGRAAARAGAGAARQGPRGRAAARPGRPHPCPAHAPGRARCRGPHLRGRADQAPAAREAPPDRHLPHQGQRRRPHRSRRSQGAQGVADRAGRRGRCQARRPRALRPRPPAPLWRGAGARRGDLGQPRRPEADQPDRRARAWAARRVPAHRAGGDGEPDAADAIGPRRSAHARAPHHRSRRCARP